ncbi:long-chain fatty acid transporter [Pseudoxanthomonas sp. SGD-10]|nr:long-chain fatty acid transporter [Pseudoxanthomonas sp. SGD-10]
MIRNIIFVFVLCIPIFSFGQGYQVNLQGQKQIGMASAGTGLALDEAAVFFNPGAVSMLQNNAVSAGISPLFLKTAFQQTGSFTTEHNESEVGTPIMAYGVWGPASGKYKLGLGVYTPFGGLTNWGQNWSGQYVLTSLNLRAIFIQPTISIKLTDNLGIGAGFVYNTGSVDLQRRIPITNSNGEPGSARLKGTGDGYGWNAGIFYKTNFGLSVGFTHRSKVITKLDDGDAIFDVPASLASTFPTKFSSQLPLPATTSIGLGYDVNPKLLLALDVNYVHWSVYESLNFDYDNNTRIPDTNSPRNYKDGGALRLGGQYQHTDKLALRAGVGYALTPVRDGYVTPETPDANRLFLSAGVGYQISDKFGIDASFFFQGVEKRTSTNIETQLSGAYKSNVYIPGISVSYRW